jgi:hypothetical protein
MATIKELKEAIKDLPDEMLIGSSGHYGEFLDCYGFSVIEVTKYAFFDDGEKFKIFSISIEDAGEEPD